MTAMLVLTTACDPGMMIRQSPSPHASSGASLSIHIKTSHSFTGATWYAPEVEITNPSGAPVTVTSVELIAGRITYQNKRTETYHLRVTPKATKVLDVWFDLQEDVKRTFRQPAALRVNYRINHEDGFAESGIIGGSLDTVFARPCALL
ncbi:MAG: hypothetical protein WCA10_23925 [Terracidiphilus sp.]